MAIRIDVFEPHKDQVILKESWRMPKKSVKPEADYFSGHDETPHTLKVRGDKRYLQVRRRDGRQTPPLLIGWLDPENGTFQLKGDDNVINLPEIGPDTVPLFPVPDLKIGLSVEPDELGKYNDAFFGLLASSK